MCSQRVVVSKFSEPFTSFVRNKHFLCIFNPCEPLKNTRHLLLQGHIGFHTSCCNLQFIKHGEEVNSYHTYTAVLLSTHRILWQELAAYSIHGSPLGSLNLRLSDQLFARF